MDEDGEIIIIITKKTLNMKASNLLSAMLMMGAMGMSAPMSYVAPCTSQKGPLSKKQQHSRNKNKAARKARKK